MTKTKMEQAKLSFDTNALLRSISHTVISHFFTNFIIVNHLSQIDPIFQYLLQLTGDIHVLNKLISL